MSKQTKTIYHINNITFTINLLNGKNLHDNERI